MRLTIEDKRRILEEAWQAAYDAACRSRDDPLRFELYLQQAETISYAQALLNNHPEPIRKFTDTLNRANKKQPS